MYNAFNITEFDLLSAITNLSVKDSSDDFFNSFKYE